MDWIGELANGVAGNIFLPLVVATVVGGLMVSIDMVNRGDMRDVHSLRFSMATGRIWTITQGLLVGWLAWALLGAVPEPDYIYRDRVKVVEKVVKVPVEKRVKVVRTVKVPVPTDRVITKTVTRVVPLAKDLRYIRLFEACMGKGVSAGGWAVSDTPETANSYAKGASEVRNERIELCHDNAREVLR